jgi:hypothetical protein
LKQQKSLYRKKQGFERSLYFRNYYFSAFW